MKNRKFVFIGNREFVLNQMLNNNLNVIMALVIKNSYLERIIENKNINYKIINSKNEVLDALSEIEFDVLISNGCPYVLPINEIKQAEYINIHPSLLPDLRGKDPVVGAILFDRTSGATCHVMNAKVDDGDIISQITIPLTQDIDVALLYQLCFIAEGEAFKLALERQFRPISKQQLREDCIYYTVNPNDKKITFEEDNEFLIKKVKAFNNKSQGCEFKYRNTNYKVYNASILNNPFIDKFSQDKNDFEILFIYENTILFKKNNEIIKFSDIKGDMTVFQLNSLISEK